MDWHFSILSKAYLELNNVSYSYLMDKNLSIMDKAEEIPLLQYTMTVTETYTQNEMEVILCVIFIFD